MKPLYSGIEDLTMGNEKDGLSRAGASFLSERDRKIDHFVNENISGSGGDASGIATDEATDGASNEGDTTLYLTDEYDGDTKEEPEKSGDQDEDDDDLDLKDIDPMTAKSPAQKHHQRFDDNDEAILSEDEDKRKSMSCVAPITADACFFFLVSLYSEVQGRKRKRRVAETEDTMEIDDLENTNTNSFRNTNNAPPANPATVTPALDDLDIGMQERSTRMRRDHGQRRRSYDYETDSNDDYSTRNSRRRLDDLRYRGRQSDRYYRRDRDRQRRAGRQRERWIDNGSDDRSRSRSRRTDRGERRGRRGFDNRGRRRDRDAGYRHDDDSSGYDDYERGRRDGYYGRRERRGYREDYSRRGFERNRRRRFYDRDEHYDSRDYSNDDNDHGRRRGHRSTQSSAARTTTTVSTGHNSLRAPSGSVHRGMTPQPAAKTSRKQSMLNI